MSGLTRSSEDDTFLMSQAATEDTTRCGTMHGTELAASSMQVVEEHADIGNIYDVEPVVGATAKKPSIAVFAECLENSLFIDYFNKYTCLPIFGQLVYYDTVTQSFNAHPNVNSADWFMRQEFLLEWLYEFRFTRYLNTKLYLEYKLCEALCNVDYFRHQDRQVEEAFEFLQLRFLRGVSKMKQFRQFLQEQQASTTHVYNSKNVGSRGDEATESVRMANGQVQYCTGYIIYNFWIDAKQLQHAIENDSMVWYALFVGIRDKYSHYASSLRLPVHLLEHECLKKWDSEAVIRSAKIFLQHLQYYWVPRYLLHQKSSGINNSDVALFSLARKYLTVKQPRFYPYCETLETCMDSMLEEADDNLDTIIRNARYRRSSGLGFQSTLNGQVQILSEKRRVSETSKDIEIDEVNKLKKPTAPLLSTVNSVVSVISCSMKMDMARMDAASTQKDTALPPSQRQPRKASGPTRLEPNGLTTKGRDFSTKREINAKRESVPTSAKSHSSADSHDLLNVLGSCVSQMTDHGSICSRMSMASNMTTPLVPRHEQRSRRESGSRCSVGRSSIAGSVHINNNSLSKISNQWRRKSRMHRGRAGGSSHTASRRSSQINAACEIITIELVDEKTQEKEARASSKGRKPQVISVVDQIDMPERKQKPRQSVIISDDVAGSNVTLGGASSTLSAGAKLSFQQMRDRRKSVVIVDEEGAEDDESFSDDTEYSIDSYWTFSSSDDSSVTGVKAARSTTGRRSRLSVLAGDRSTTSISKGWRKSRTMLGMKSDTSMVSAISGISGKPGELRALNQVLNLQVEDSPNSSNDSSQRPSHLAGMDGIPHTNSIPGLVGSDHINIITNDEFGVEDYSVMDATLAIPEMQAERKYKFGCIIDPLKNSTAGTVPRKGRGGFGESGESDESNLPLPKSLVLTDKNANRIRDTRRKSRNSVKKPCYDTILEEEDSKLKLGNLNATKNEKQEEIIVEKERHVPLASQKPSPAMSRRTSMTIITGSHVRQPRSSVLTHAREPSVKPSVLADVAPHFGTSGVESFLRSFVNNSGALHRDTSIIQSAVKSMNRIEIMPSKSQKLTEQQQTESGMSVQVQPNTMSRSKLSKSKFSKASIVSMNSVQLESDSDKDEVELTLDKAGKSVTKKIRQIRKTATFAFNLAAVNAEDTEDTENEELTDDDKQKSTNNKNAKKHQQDKVPPKKIRKSNTPSIFELNREAITRATKNKVEEKRLKWEKGQKVRRRSSVSQFLDPEEARIARQKRGSRRSTANTGNTLSNLIKFQAKNITNNISYTEDRQWRTKNEFVVHAFQTDEHGGYPFRQWLFEEELFTQISLLSAWVDLDRLRTSEQLGAELRSHAQYASYCRNLIAKCLHDDDSEINCYVSPVLKEMLEAITPDTIFDIPIACIKLQRDIFEELETFFKDYVRQETRRFRQLTCIQRRGISIRRVSFTTDGIDDMGDDDYNHMNYNKNIKTRTWRSTALALDLAHVHKYTKFSKDENNYLSDDNGDYQDLSTKQVFRKSKKPTAEELYKNVKVEYPVTGYKCLHTDVNSTDDYLRPIRKQGNIILRPTQRPKSIKDILKNQVHFEFFRRYLKFHRVDKMLVFWKAIEIMKNTINIRQRQMKAQNIMEKFFHCPEKKPCELLFCNAPIIMEIPGLEIVTTSMLFFGTTYDSSSNGSRLVSELHGHLPQSRIYGHQTRRRKIKSHRQYAHHQRPARCHSRTKSSTFPKRRYT